MHACEAWLLKPTKQPTLSQDWLLLLLLYGYIFRYSYSELQLILTRNEKQASIHAEAETAHE